ncbi:MAG TPA: T9SS type A sorting domain-containing protein [bacterium]
MKHITVILFLICCLFGEWQQTEEIVLPKGIQINDIAISKEGEIWLLSSATILKLEPSSKTPLIISGISGARLFAIGDATVYLVRDNNRLALFDINKGTDEESEAIFAAPSKLKVVSAAGQNSLIALEAGRLTFWENGKMVGAIPADAQKFATVPLADYAESSIPLYTLKDNRVYAWTGGAFQHAENYRNRVVYSSSGTILDITADKSGKLYMLFADSIVVLNSEGKYTGKVQTPGMPSESELIANPANQSLVLFDKTNRKLVMFNETKKDNGDLITLNKNSPNPVDNYTEIEFTLGRSLNITMTVYNLIGEPVRVLAKGQFGMGTHRVHWDACDQKGNLVPNGVYFYRLESNKGVAIKQLVVLR